MPAWLIIYLLIGFGIGIAIDAVMIFSAGSLGDLNFYFVFACIFVLLLFTAAWLPCLLLALCGWALQTMGFIE